MLSSAGFDLWAEGYDRAVGLSDEDGSYPFAGYRAVLNAVYQDIRSDGQARSVLDLGVGTGTLAARLCQDGYAVTGVDFSPRMLEIAGERTGGKARLLAHDFHDGFPAALADERFDRIVCTYALHHLTDEEKPAFLRALTDHLTEQGRVLIGDVAFPTRALLEACREQAGDEFDDEECYLVADELPPLPGIKASFAVKSPCAGVLTLERSPDA
ncbi:MAG: class I SAM-dependent methyltransferase [Christensenellaceae bacterium]|nr:class I SAM-dependent methyltransferase [Christensenellaceae bacterium]